MNFNENPKLFIIDYFENKINQIDLNCENAILKFKQEDQCSMSSEDSDQHLNLTSEEFDHQQIFNQVRLDLIETIRSARQEVLERFDKLEFMDGIELSDQIKDHIFCDKYCYILERDENFLIPSMFDAKEIGVLIFSEYNDDLLDNLRYYF